jgi:hypothetical protein
LARAERLAVGVRLPLLAADLFDCLRGLKLKNVARRRMINRIRIFRSRTAPASAAACSSGRIAEREEAAATY